MKAKKRKKLAKKIAKRRIGHGVRKVEVANPLAKTPIAGSALNAVKTAIPGTKTPIVADRINVSDPPSITVADPIEGLA